MTPNLDCVAEVKKRLANYKTFREIIDGLIALSIQQGKIDLFGPRPTPLVQDEHKRSRRHPRERHNLKSKSS